MASYVALFLLVVFLGDRLVALSAEKMVRHSKNQFVKMYEGKARADIVFLGNSRVDRNISFEKVEEMTGKRCLNLGLGGNHMLISEALLKDYVERYGNPQLVIIELSHSTVKPVDMGEMGIFTYCSTNMSALARSINPTYFACERVFHSLQFNTQTFWRLSAEVFSQPSSRLLNNTIPPPILAHWKNGAHDELPLIEENAKALRRICDYANSRNLRIRLVIGPLWKEYRNRITNFEAWKSMLQNAAGADPVYDYSELFFDHEDYFNDEMHLNATGANCFTEKLMTDKVLLSAAVLSK